MCSDSDSYVNTYLTLRYIVVKISLIKEFIKGVKISASLRKYNYRACFFTTVHSAVNAGFCQFSFYVKKKRSEK